MVCSFACRDRSTCSLLPPVRPVTELAPIMPLTARELGLPASALVAVGCGDDIELLGATAHQPETAVEHVGTTGAMLRALEPGVLPILDGTLELYPTSVPERYAVGASTPQAGAVFDWLHHALGVDPTGVFAQDPDNLTPVATAGLFAERGDRERSRRGATIRGLVAQHTRIDIARSLVVAATLTMRLILERIEERTGPVATIYASGSAGGAEWTRWRASAYGRPLAVLSDDPTTRGCVAVGIAARSGRMSLEEVAAELSWVQTLVEPDFTLAKTMAQLAEHQRIDVPKAHDRQQRVKRPET